MSVLPRPKVTSVEWQEDALDWAATWGLKTSDVEDVIKQPYDMAVDPRSGEAGHEIMRYRRGDVIVVAGLRNPKIPVVLYVTTVTGIEAKKKAGGRSGSTAPRTFTDMRRRIEKLGYTIEVLNQGQLGVFNENGHKVYVMPSTPSEYRSLLNSWMGFLRAHREDADVHLVKNKD